MLSGKCSVIESVVQGFCVPGFLRTFTIRFAQSDGSVFSVSVCVCLSRCLFDRYHSNQCCDVNMIQPIYIWISYTRGAHDEFTDLVLPAVNSNVLNRFPSVAC